MDFYSVTVYIFPMDQSFEFDFNEAAKRLIRYLLEGVVVGVSVQLIASKKISVNEIVLIGVTAAAVLSLLDTFSPTISSGARNGMGLGLGLQTVGYSGPFLPYNV